MQWHIMIEASDDIAVSIRAARQSKRLTQRELGQRVGLPQSHISKIETGAVDLQLSSLTEIARALDLEIKLIPRTVLPAVEAMMRGQDLGGEDIPRQRPAYRLEEDDI
jgi:transcriptional regulator with XRE-family HTH domain